MTDVLVQPNFFQTDADESLFSNPDDSLDNFSEQSGLDYTDYVQALQVLENILQLQHILVKLFWSGLEG